MTPPQVFWRRTAIAVVGLAVLGWGAVTWWTRSQVIEAGEAVVLVEGRDLILGTEAIAGVGITGTLGLVGGTCVGFVDGFGDDAGDGTIIVWPAGTTVDGSGEDLTITADGATVTIGDTVDGGSAQVTAFPEFDGRLPEECEDAPLVDVSLE